MIVWIQSFQRLDFEKTKLAIGDDQEIAAAAGWVEQLQGCELVLEGPQGLFAPSLEINCARELGPQIVQEQRLDNLQDVLFGGVVGTLGSASFSASDFSARMIRYFPPL